jgi:hypothetical protein
MADQQDIPMFMDAPEGASADAGVAPVGAPMSDVQAMASEMVTRGIWTADQAAEALAKSDDEEGFNPLAAAPAKPVVPEGVDELTAAAFAGPASPTAYRFAPPPEGTKAAPEQELMVRQLFHEHEVPVSIGNEISKRFNAAAVNPPTEQQIEMGRQSAMVTLNKMWGEQTAANIAVANAEVMRMAQAKPEIIDMLINTGLGNDPWVVSTIYQMARAKGRA